HSGALMSSRFTPPSVGSSAAMMSTSLSGSRSASSMSNTSMPANFWNRQPLPSMTGLPASGPMSPRPSTAVPLVTTPTRLAREASGFSRFDRPRGCASPTSARLHQQREVLDLRRLSEVRADDGAPLREERAAAERHGVVLERVPVDHQDVALGRLHALVHLVA